MDRRQFIASSAAAGLARAAGQPLPRRSFKAGIELSVIGFGGIVVCGMDRNAAARRVADAFDRGVNYYDCAPSYFDGEAEIKLGEALKPYRGKVFLAEKSQKRDAAGARAELELSLQRFSTDYFDLYQFHAVTSMEEVDKILAPKGAAEAFMQARREGKVRFLGLSAHEPQAAIRLMNALPLDSILFPVNFAAWETGFGPQMLEEAKKKGMARLALKALARGRWPKTLQGPDRWAPKCWYEPVRDRRLAALALRFSLGQDITAAIPPGDESIFGLAMDLAAQPLPRLNAEELNQLRQGIGAAEPIFRV
jgi:aryl-alcohol dehydrogenase-like predicted oxidoreductase